MNRLYVHPQVSMLLQNNVIVTSHMHLHISCSIAVACDKSYNFQNGDMLFNNGGKFVVILKERGKITKLTL